MEYTNINGYLIPNLVYEETEKPHYGRYGRMRLDFLREHDPISLDLLTIEGQLTAHLNEVDDAANEQLSIIISQMAERQGVNEDLKRRDPLAWVDAMNNIRSAAEEIILTDIVFSMM